MKTDVDLVKLVASCYVTGWMHKVLSSCCLSQKIRNMKLFFRHEQFGCQLSPQDSRVDSWEMKECQDW